MWLNCLLLFLTVGFNPLNADKAHMMGYNISISSIQQCDDVIVELPTSQEETSLCTDGEFTLRLQISLNESQDKICQNDQFFKVLITYDGDSGNRTLNELDVCGRPGEKTWFTVINSSSEIAPLCAAIPVKLPVSSNYSTCRCTYGSLDYMFIVCVRKSIDLQNDVNLYLYTKKNSTTGTKIHVEEGYVPPDFNSSAEVRVLINGWHSTDTQLNSIREGYLNETEYINVVVVEWTHATSELYPIAKSTIFEIAPYLTRFIKLLVSYGVTSLDQIVLLGHSLGAQLAAIVGYELDGKLAMIVGLDPALPLFRKENLNNRLDPSDAQVVQVIHTCSNFLGWEDPLGTVDFYPNGGVYPQPGCGEDPSGACSHHRSFEYFAESLTSPRFIGHTCSSYDNFLNGSCENNPTAIMGDDMDRRVNGSYYMKTASSPPFGLGD